MQKFKLIIEIGQVPPDTVCTKPTGEKIYKVADALRIFAGDGKCSEIQAGAGTRFMICDNRNILSVPADQMVAVTGTAQELINLLATLLPRK